MELRDILNELNNSHSVIHGLVSSGAVTGLALVDPRTLTLRQRLAYRSAIAGLTAWVMHAGLRPTNDEDLDLIGPIGRAAITTGSAGAALGLTEVGEALDARLVTCVKRTGTRHPRRWLAAGEGALATATWWLGRRLDDTNDLDLTPSAPSRTLHEVPENMREIVALLLEATDEFAAQQLREQLAAASVCCWDGEAPDFDGAPFHVPNHIPRVVPGTYKFPVIGRFTALEDLTFAIEISIEDGYLASVDIECTPEWTAEQYQRWEEICDSISDHDLIPAPDDIELLIETNAGYQPVER